MMYRAAGIYDSFKRSGWIYLERVTWIVIVGTAAFGIPSLIVEHHFQLERDRQAATLEFAKIFQGPHLVEKRLTLLAPWLEGDYDVQRLRKLGVSTADARAIRMTRTALPITSAGRFSPLGPRGISPLRLTIYAHSFRSSAFVWPLVRAL
jgi:hypothetical protein